MRKVLLALVMRIETLDNHIEGVKDRLVRFGFENDINEGEDTGIEYINVKNNEKSIDYLSNTRGTCGNGGNAKKIMGNTLGTGFSCMQCSIKKRRLKGTIILNNRGGIFRSLCDSNQKLIKMHEFSREKDGCSIYLICDESEIKFYKCLYLDQLPGCDSEC
ncbi:22630_t:CDS:2 [Gigaspora margarita]|uniref:22630_t:CDS:1 n=1 Tax=Gigaspora margarita TaxID=4874 RepID=A0ABM8W5N2_GIGMA|nr:22630_t:CDS:2 [Gigaspora margarita]